MGKHKKKTPSQEFYLGMSKLSSFAALTAAAFVFSSVGSAQTLTYDYDFNWAPMSNAPSVGLPGPLIFGTVLFGTPHPPGIGDAIRRCYSVDVTQGGKNQTGTYETTWLTIMQGWGANNAIPGNDVGLTSIQSATDSDIGGDSCLSPFFSSLGNTGGHDVSATAVIGLLGGTAGTPWPGVWQSVFQWSQPTGSTFVGAGLPGVNTIGVDSNGLPLLANVIYEIQGPINSSNANIQYYLGSTDENNGLGQTSLIPNRGTGGVTNGNSQWGSSLFGVSADQSNAVAHSRLFGLDPVSGGLTATTPFWGPAAGSDELNLFVAFATPFLWAENNGSVGGGGADWNIGSGTPSNVNVWLKDIKSGAEGTSDVLWKVGGGGAAGAAFDPTLALQFGYFVWSKTPASSMLQKPMSWDDLSGAIPPQPGSVILGQVATTREGLQTIPANFDALTNVILGNPGLSQGTQFTGADSVWYDAGPAGLQAIWEGAFDAVESGLSKLKINGGNAFPVAQAANPAKAGTNAGIAAASIQVRINPQFGVIVSVAEIASSLTITLQ